MMLWRSEVVGMVSEVGGRVGVSQGFVAGGWWWVRNGSGGYMNGGHVFCSHVVHFWEGWAG